MPSDYLKILPHYLLPKHALTAFAGCLANVKYPAVKNYLIRDFIARYDVNMHEAREEDIESYACFNDFFTRHLKPECRPIALADIISPVDGMISEIGAITSGKLLQAKGREYSVEELLACPHEITSQFNNGCFATIYLSPKDYHRVHMPIDAQIKDVIYVPGRLFSVQPKTARAIPCLFARNERLVVIFETKVGLMAMVLVGATIVGAIGTSWSGDIARGRKRKVLSHNNHILHKASEMGYFKLGSTVVLLFAQDACVQWRDALRAGDKIRIGEALATIDPNTNF